MFKVSTIALEGYTDAQIAAANAEYASAASKSWNSPQEFAVIFPDIKKADKRELIKKAAKAAGTPEGVRVSDMCILIDNLRWATGEDLAWRKLQKVFPTVSDSKQTYFFAICLALWGIPQTGAKLEELIYDWDLAPFLVEDEYWVHIKNDRSFLDAEMNIRIKRQEELKQALSTSKTPIVDEDKIDELEYEIQSLEVAEDVLDENYSRAFSSLRSMHVGNRPSDAAAMLIEMVKLFKLT